MLRAPKLRAHGFLHGFSLRQQRDGFVPTAPSVGAHVTGATNVTEDSADTRRFAGALGIDPERLYLVKQVHGRDVRHVRAQDEPVRVLEESADALVTGVRGVAIAVRTADCVPVLLADVQTRKVAAVHAGWRGVVAGVVSDSVCALRDAGAESAVVAAIFPHIGPCCFEVGEDVAGLIAGALSDAAADASVIRRAPGRNPHADLAQVVIAQLRASGVADIEVVEGCTRCDATRFFSYRREGVGCGVHLTAIVGG